MFAIDTNIFVYAHFENYPQHPKARRFCEELLRSGDDWCIAWQIVYEYVRITTHPSIHRLPLSIERALADLQPYLSADSGHVLTHSDQHLPILEAVARGAPTARGNFIHDVHYATLLREHGISRIYTADSDFEKFGFLEVVDPTV
jgi:uncharacterized protein